MRMLPRAVVAAGTLVATIVAGGLATAQDRFSTRTSFRVESSERVFAGAPAVEGYVHNEGPFRLSNIRLKVEALDAAGAVLEEALGWVFGDLEPVGRAYFMVALKGTGASYRVSVLSFDVDAAQSRQP